VVLKFLIFGSLPSSLLLAGLLNAQTPAVQVGVVSGIVHSGQGAPVPLASIALRRSSDTLLVARSVSDSTGAFRIGGVAHGSYRVEVRRLGYRMLTRSGVTITARSNRVDLGIIRMAPVATALEGVVVSAARPLVTVLPDRNVYSLSGMPVAAGGMATDVLRRIPELQVSVEGSVTARGATPEIYINGRPPPMQGEALDRYLQQLPAERIERVEVISNPSARYEADGQGGIVNIVLKRGTGLGLSGSVAANAGTHNQQGGSGSLNFHRGRLSLFGSASVSLFGTRSRNSDLRQNLQAQPTTYIQQDSRNRNSGGMGNVTLGAELEEGPRGTFWADVNAGHNPTHTEALVAYALRDQIMAPTERYDRVNDAERRGLFGSFATGYRNVAAAGGGEWSVELRRNVNVIDYTDESERRHLNTDGAVLDLAPELTFAGQGQDQGGLSLEANVTRPWGDSGQVEAGYRGSLRTTGDDFHTWVGAAGDPPGAAGEEAVGDFRQRERIHAAFVSVSRQIGRVYVQAGLRGEQAELRRALPLSGETFGFDYWNLFPNALVSTEFGTVGQVSLSYSRRVDRPWGGILNPATPSLDPLNRRIGNPYLMPRYTHSLSLAVTRTGRLGTLQFSPYYQRTVHGWDQVRTVDEAGVSTVTWQNVATVSSYGGSLSASPMPTGRVSGILNVTAYREVRDASNLQTDLSGSSTQLSVMGTASVRATSALSLEGFLTYLPGRNVPQGKTSPMVFSTLGVRHPLWGRRGAISLSVVDPFELQRFTFTTRDRTHVQTGSSTFSARRATLGISYSFGQRLQRKGRGTPDEGQPESQAPVIR
jgi:hypothetical protein